MWEEPQPDAADRPPDEIAGVAVLLAARAGSYVNGQVVAVDGGDTIARSC